MPLTRGFPKVLVLVATIGAVVASASVAQPSVRPQPLRGSRASVELMYTRAIAEDLDFHETPDDVYRAAMAGRLKMISFTEDVALDETRYPFVLPQTFDFITQLAEQYHAQCGERIVVTSAARPAEKQPRNSVRESVHPTGMAVDFHRPAEPCVTWLRKALVQLEDRGLIEATEERRPPHFHVAVLQRSTTHYAVNVDLSAIKARPRIEAASSGEIASADTVLSKNDSLSTAATTVARAIDTAAAATRDTAGTPDAPKTRVARTPNAVANKVNRSSDSNKARTASSASANVHRVESGDNLSTIARRHRTTVERLQELNHLRTAKIRIGQQLRLP